jgi:molecular chaperone GrpE
MEINLMSNGQKALQRDEKQLETLLQDLDVERKRSEDCLTRLKYMQADYENFKKRHDRELEEARKYCTERIILELLEVVDELEMAVNSGRSSKPSEAIVRGVEITLKKLEKVLKNEGVSPIECVGKAFDPSKHDAVARIEKDGVEDCMVIEEVRRGYIMRGRVIRPSIVKIAVKPANKSQEEMNVDE